VYSAPIENGQTDRHVTNVFLCLPNNSQPPGNLIKGTVRDQTCHCVRSFVGWHFEWGFWCELWLDEQL